MELKTINSGLRKITDFISSYILPGAIFLVIIITLKGRPGELFLNQFSFPNYVYYLSYPLVIILPLFWFKLYSFSPTNGKVFLDESNIKWTSVNTEQRLKIALISELKLYIKPSKLFFLNKNFIYINDQNIFYRIEILIENLDRQEELLSLFDKWKEINPNVRRTWTNLH